MGTSWDQLLEIKGLERDAMAARSHLNKPEILLKTAVIVGLMAFSLI